MGPAREEKGALVWGREAVTQGWKGVNPAAAWQAGSGVCRGWEAGPSCIPGGIFGGSVGLGGLDFRSILSPSDLTRVGHPWVSDKFTHL